VLKKSTSSTNMQIKLNRLTDEAFKHPILKSRIEEIKQNATHYCANKNRIGVKRTTSIVDNFLKLAKEKLQKIKCFVSYSNLMLGKQKHKKRTSPLSTSLFLIKKVCALTKLIVR